MLTSIHFSNHRNFCIQTHCGQTHICLCPCKRSRLEPLCVHKYSQVYMFQITDTLVYKPTVCKLTNVCALASAHTLNLVLYMQISRSIYTILDIYFKYIVWWTLLYKNPRCGNLHTSMPLRALTVRTSLCTCKYSQVCIFQITNAFVYNPIVCKLTFICALALASAHTSNLVFIHANFQKYIYN